ncbi:hypothetical protein VRZ08_00910 [Rhodopseudomonas sp. G2_2311]|uniref:hypothetical protein n=1 Tax=Rhodopseudomonas sp. G2_2311 TaxID=3114287 RepID=UPI0039C6C7DD
MIDGDAKSLRDQISRISAERDAILRQAEAHALEARTANATIYEIYRVVSGATGEPGNWNGAEPVRKAFEAQRAEAKRLTQGYRDIMRAAIEGRICDDVAWFDTITTLHDFCDFMINPATWAAAETEAAR